MANVIPKEADSVLARAAGELRDEPGEPRWVEISTSIISKVRGTARRTWPIDAVYPLDTQSQDRPALDTADTLRVSDQVVRTTMRRALAGISGTQPTDISLHVDEHRCTGVSIAVTGLYGQDLQAVGEVLAYRAIEVIDDVLGVGLARADVDIRVDDIEFSP